MANDTKYRVLYLAELGSLLPSDATRKDRKLRSTPLPYIKFRTAADTTPAGQRYMMRRLAVKAADEGFGKLAVYDELLGTYGGDRIAPLRGYLVNHDFRPASIGEIAQAIGCFDRGLVAAALDTLRDVGLLVWREMSYDDFQQAIKADKSLAPEYDPPDDPDDDCADDGLLFEQVQAADDARKGTRQQSRARAQTANESPRSRGRKAAAAAKASHGAAMAAPRQCLGSEGRTRDVTRDTADGRPPDGTPQPPQDSAAPSSSASGCGRPEDLKDAAPAAPPPQDEPTAQAAPGPADGLTPDDRPDTPPPSADNQTRADETREPDDLTTDDARPGPCDPPQEPLPQATDDATPTPDAQPQDDPQGTPAEAEPPEPTQADPEQGQELQARPEGKPTRSLGDLAWHAEAYALQVVDVLYPTRDDLVKGGMRYEPPETADNFRTRELASIASVLGKSLAGLDQVAAIRLLEHSIALAHQARRKKAKKTYGKLWNYMFYESQTAAKMGQRGNRAGGSGPP